MFTFITRPPPNECVYNLIEQTIDHRARGPPIYRSRYSCMVRQEANCRKIGCWKTMGVPKICQCPPDFYLKKQSRAPITIQPCEPRIKICNPCCKSEDSAAPAAEGAACDSGDSPAPAEGAACDSGDSPAEGAACDKPCEDCPAPKPDACKPKKQACCVPKCRVPRLCCNIPKPPVPSPCTGFGIIPRGCKNYIHGNIVKSLRMPAKKPTIFKMDDEKGSKPLWTEPESDCKYLCKPTYGCVPGYVQCIKADQMRNDCQAKYDMKFKERDIQQQVRHLDPTEHQALVCGLKKNWEEKFNEFQCMSLVLDTPMKIKKKACLEEELKNLEKDIQLLERHDHIFVSDTCRPFYLA